MSSDLIRWGGLAGVMYVLADILGDLAPQQRVFDTFSDYLQEVIFAVAVAGTLGAIAGLHALHSGRYGRLGAAGSLLAFIGYALFFVRTAVTILVGGQAPLYAVRISIVGALAVLIGSVLLGAMTLPHGYCHGGAVCCSSSAFPSRWPRRWPSAQPGGLC